MSWTPGRHNLFERLCQSRGAKGQEVCKINEITENELFILIQAVKDHSEGTLTLTGSNLISSEIQSK